MTLAIPDAWAEHGPVPCQTCGPRTCETHLPFEDAATPRAALGLTLDELQQHQFPARRTLLLRGDTPILCAGHLGELFAERGLGKTWLLQTLGLVAASSASALGFRAPAPCRVLYLDGEMAAEDLKARFALLTKALRIPASAMLTTVAADWQTDYLPRLDTLAGQAYIEPWIEAADLILIDNRSCLFDPEGEKDPTAWQPAQDWLLSLRRRGKAVLMAHHANRQGGARGHSKAEDPLNLILKLARPDGYTADQGSRFTVTFEKARGAYGADVAPFTARLMRDGWHTEAGGASSTGSRLLEIVRIAELASEPVNSATAAIRAAGVNRAAGLKAWADLLKSGAICGHPGGGFHLS